MTHVVDIELALYVRFDGLDRPELSDCGDGIDEAPLIDDQIVVALGAQQQAIARVLDRHHLADARLDQADVEREGEGGIEVGGKQLPYNARPVVHVLRQDDVQRPFRAALVPPLDGPGERGGDGRPDIGTDRHPHHISLGDPGGDLLRIIYMDCGDILDAEVLSALSVDGLDGVSTRPVQKIDQGGIDVDEADTVAVGCEDLADEGTPDVPRPPLYKDWFHRSPPLS